MHTRALFLHRWPTVEAAYRCNRSFKPAKKPRLHFKISTVNRHSKGSVMSVDSPLRPQAGASSSPFMEAPVVSEAELAKEKVAEYPPRTLSNPYVSQPVSCAALSFEEAKNSVVLQSNLFRLETRESPLDEYLDPIDDAIDRNTYVGDWEELFIRTYSRVFSELDQQLYWGKSEIGLFVTAVGKAVEDLGYPTLSLGPNGYHFAHLPAGADHAEFPSTKTLCKLFPHFEEIKFTHAKDPEKLASELLAFEEKMKPTRYKFGLLYMREGQTEENDIYSNLDPSVGFVEFAQRIGTLIELANHKAYRGGLDCSGANTTGELSLYTTVELADGRYIPKGTKPPGDTQEIVRLEIMFHVAPFLPHSSQKDDQQLHKKRHLGNDIVVVIFKVRNLDGKSKFDPQVFKSQFNHVYIVVTPCSEKGGGPATHYKIEVVTKGLKGFLPRIPDSEIIAADKIHDWLLLKLINGEVTAMRSKDFRLKMKRTRAQTLESWAKTHMTTEAGGFGSVRMK